MKKTWKIMPAILLSIVLAISSGCKKETPENVGNNNGDDNTTSDVRVTTYTPQSVSYTTALCGGDAIVIQGLALTEIGVCWSESRNPTVEDFHLSTTNWKEPYVCTLTGLEPGTTYYVRAYALRGLEYYYGTEKSFTTEANDSGVNQPIISVIQEEGFVQDGDIVDVGLDYWFGFTMASNTETERELKTLEVVINGDGYVVDNQIEDLSGMTEYSYVDGIMFSLDAKEIIGEAVITATVTDVDGNANSATINLSINRPDYAENYVGNYFGSGTIVISSLNNVSSNMSFPMDSISISIAKGTENNVVSATVAIGSSVSQTTGIVTNQKVDFEAFHLFIDMTDQDYWFEWDLKLEGTKNGDNTLNITGSFTGNGLFLFMGNVINLNEMSGTIEGVLLKQN